MPQSHDSSPLPLRLPAGARVVFAGQLSSMTHKDAWRAVRSAGGRPAGVVSRRTDLLVVGQHGWPLQSDGSVSGNLRRARELDVRIVPEHAFLKLVGRDSLAPPGKPYTADVICRLLNVTPAALRAWERHGLVTSQHGSYDYADIVSLRAIADLVARGVRAEKIAESLRSLAPLLPGTERPLAQLRLVSDSPRQIVAEIGDLRVRPDGQLLLNFDPQRTDAPAPETLKLRHDDESATEWFERAQLLEDEQDFDGAVNAYRRAIALEPRFPEVYFNLGNALRGLAKPDAAIEMYHLAAAQDPTLAEAWYNAADVHEEQGRVEESIRCLRAALQASPSYCDAHFNLALCYEQTGCVGEALTHWREYLRLDPSSDWSRIARQHVEQLTRRNGGEKVSKS
ncbi:MAG: DNA ligase [Phycisphaerae bacterium]|nr:DNA ligase [Phycisphaerae bacterium]